MAAETPDLDRLTAARAAEEIIECATQQDEIFGYTEVWPVKVFV